MAVLKILETHRKVSTVKFLTRKVYSLLLKSLQKTCPSQMIPWEFSITFGAAFCQTPQHSCYYLPTTIIY